MNKSTGKGSSKHNPYSRKAERLCHNRTGRRYVGTETAVKHNKNQGNGTDGFRCGIITEGDTQRPVGPKEHAKTDKDQQRRDRELFGKLVQKYAGKKHNSN